MRENGWSDFDGSSPRHHQCPADCCIRAPACGNGNTPPALPSAGPAPCRNGLWRGCHTVPHRGRGEGGRCSKPAHSGADGEYRPSCPKGVRAAAVGAQFIPSAAMLAKQFQHETGPLYFLQTLLLFWYLLKLRCRRPGCGRCCKRI